MLPGKDLFEQEKAKLIDEQGNPTTWYQVYIRYQENWKAKRKAHQQAYHTARTNPKLMYSWGVTGKLYIADINQAMHEWITYGHKHEIENAANILAPHTSDSQLLDLIRKIKEGANLENY